MSKTPITDAVADLRAEIARLTAEHRAEIDAERAEADRAVADLRAEIDRLTAELAAARAVPPDVDTAIIEAAEAACRVTSAEEASHLNRSNSEIADAKRDYSEQDKILRAAIARAIAEARQPATVGGLLATLDPHGDQVIEFDDGDIAPMQNALGPHIAHRMWCDGYWPSEWEDSEVQHRWLAMPARLVPASEADADPATRGPLPKGG